MGNCKLQKKMTKVPEMWKWRSASNDEYAGYSYENDTWNPSHMNVANAGVSFGMYFMFVHFHVWEWLSILLVMLLTFIWQCKNAMVPSLTKTGTYRYFGGPGYSYIAQIYGAAGVFLAFLLDVMWPPAIQPAKNGENYNELEGDGDMAF